MRILDVCCGSEMIYHGMQANLPGFVTMDIRSGQYEWPGISSGYITVKPTMLADMQCIPLKDNSIDLIICDPPHMDISLTSIFTKKYGSWDQRDTNRIITLANIEFARVLKPTGTIILKVTPAIADRYFKLLSKFQFFLPIQTVRASGFVKTEEQRNGAAWYVGAVRS